MNAREAMADQTHAIDFEPLHEVCLRRMNLLLIGAAPKVDALIARIKRLVETPISVCALPGTLTLPEVGSVLLRDISALTRTQQQALLRWMNQRRTRVQIISATSQRLFTQVKVGLFSDQLYYRLNMVLVYV